MEKLAEVSRRRRAVGTLVVMIRPVALLVGVAALIAEMIT